MEQQQKKSIDSVLGDRLSSLLKKNMPSRTEFDGQKAEINALKQTCEQLHKQLLGCEEKLTKMPESA
jgi:polyhydroxyalkanoate synthesis regulator phasin